MTNCRPKREERVKAEGPRLHTQGSREEQWGVQRTEASPAWQDPNTSSWQMGKEGSLHGVGEGFGGVQKQTLRAPRLLRCSARDVRDEQGEHINQSTQTQPQPCSNSFLACRSEIQTLNPKELGPGSSKLCLRTREASPWLIVLYPTSRCLAQPEM